jgi:hypothetical protein
MEKNKINGMLDKIETVKRGSGNNNYKRVMDH